MLTCSQASFPFFSVADFRTSAEKKKFARSQVRLNVNCTHHCGTDKNPESEAHDKSIEKWQFQFRVLSSHKSMTSFCVIRAQLRSFPSGYFKSQWNYSKHPQIRTYDFGAQAELVLIYLVLSKKQPEMFLKFVSEMLYIIPY